MEEQPIGKGTTIVVVRDTLLAAAMIAVGIPLRKDPPYVHVRLANGAEQWSFNFHESDEEGEIKAKDCIEGWQQDLNWVKANPRHPFSYAMTAVLNWARIREHQDNSRPFHVYEMPPNDDGTIPHLVVMAESKKEKLAIEKGYVRL